MIEPNRFTTNQCNLIEDQFQLPKNTIYNLKSEKISKAWIWKDTGKIIFFKKKDDIHIKHEKIKFNLNNIKTFKLNQIIDQPILEIDDILDKISKNGISSLSTNELEFLNEIQKVTKK